jgi:hypothetical protein
MRCDAVRLMQQPIWREELSRLNWLPMFKDGAVLRDYLDNERAEFVVTLRELGLLSRSVAA